MLTKTSTHYSIYILLKFFMFISLSLRSELSEDLIAECYTNAYSHIYRYLIFIPIAMIFYGICAYYVKTTSEVKLVYFCLFQ